MVRVEYDLEDIREFIPKTIHGGLPQYLRVEVQCPFCSKYFEAYLTTLRSVGKKCPDCGALHLIIDFTGQAVPVKEA